MKYRNAVVAVIAAALMLLGACMGTAGATVLCTEAKSPCPKDVPAGTSITMSLSTKSAIFETTSGTVLNTCTGTTIKGTTSNTGGKGTAVKGSASEWTFSGCTKETKMVAPGELEITHIAGTHNGTVRARNYQITVNGLFVNESCIYGAGAGLQLGTLVGGSPATLSISTLVGRQPGGGPFCPAEARWTTAYKVDQPNPLFIEAE